MTDEYVFYKNIIAPTLAPLILIAGWFFVSRDNDRRETRKELRALINEYRQKVEALVEVANTYFSQVDNINCPEDAQLQEIAIKQKLERVEVNLSLIQRIDERYQSLNHYLTKLADSITAHQKFESRSAGVAVLKPTDPSLLTIKLNAYRLCDEMEEIFISSQIRKGCWQEDASL